MNNSAINGTIAGPITGNHTITFPNAGIYRVKITGAYPMVSFAGGGAPVSDNDKLLTIEQWGSIAWKSFRYAFAGCENLTVPATDAPDLTQVTDMSGMFIEAVNFNQPINHWNVSNVIYMAGMFQNASIFNQPLDSWDVSSIMDMSRVFYRAINFNQPIGSWNVSNVTNMSGMFLGTSSFNQPLGAWNVSSVVDMSGMFHGATNFNQPIEVWNVSQVNNMNTLFYGASSFNQPLGNWDASSVVDMQGMFGGAANFNQPIDTWDVSHVTNMSSTFYAATSFIQPIGSWNVSSVVDMQGMFGGAANFNQPIDTWDVGSVVDMSGMFNGALKFNQPIGSWNVSNVTAMTEMFAGATSFDQQLGNWDVSNVTSMIRMFSGASSFNRPIGTWNVSSVLNMSGMFAGATNFNQPIGTWDVGNVVNMAYMFKDAYNFNMPIDDWDVKNVTDMSFMFSSEGSNRHKFNQPIGNWNTSMVNNMRKMFSNATSFNQPIGSWNVSNVTNMLGMFNIAEGFNQPIGSWNVSNVTNMLGMFAAAKAFNQPIENWDVSQVTTMQYMFSFANAFNQPLGNWDVSKVKDMLGMFNPTISFNQPLANWNVSSVERMTVMFSEAISFNQSLKNWNIINVTEMGGMLDNTSIELSNYDETLIGWAIKNVKSNVPLGAAGLKYCLGAAARDQLIAKGWLITGDISLVPANPAVHFNRPCAGDKGIIYVDVQNPSDTYSFDGGVSFQTDSIITGLNPGLYTVVIKNAAGCKSLPQSVTIDQPFERSPTPLLSGTAVVCPNILEVEYSASNIAYTYQWFVEGGVFSQQDNEIKVNWGPSNFNASVKAIGFDQNNCPTDTAVFPVKVQIQLKPTLPAGFDSVCYNFRAGVPYQTTNTIGSTYTWFTNGGLVAQGQGTSNIKINWANLGDYKLWVKEENTTSTDFCEGFSDTLNLTVFKDLAAITLNFVSVDFTDDKNVQVKWEVSLLERVSDLIIVSRRVAGSNDPWQQVATLNKNVQSFLDQNVATSTNAYEYKVEGFNKCDEGLQTVIHNTIKLDGNKVDAEELINLNWNDYNGWDVVEHYEVWRKVDDEQLYKLIGVTPGDLTDYSGKHGADGFVHHLRIKAKKEGSNTISWSNEIELDFENPIDFIPNVITPNDDGKNDLFVIPKLNLYPVNALNIYDRWGQVVFSKINYDNTWNAEELSGGIYFYSLSVNGVQKNLKGWIHVIR